MPGAFKVPCCTVWWPPVLGSQLDVIITAAVAAYLAAWHWQLQEWYRAAVQGNGRGVELTRCRCKAGWGGVGCEVAVPGLPPNTAVTLVPTFNPDMKLVSNASLSQRWSLYHFQVLIAYALHAALARCTHGQRCR
jgi:hypothetical protein